MFNDENESVGLSPRACLLVICLYKRDLLHFIISFDHFFSKKLFYSFLKCDYQHFSCFSKK